MGLGIDMKFLIQHNLMHEERLKKVKNAVTYLPHEFIGVVPFSREITSDEPLVGTDFIPYGSTLLTNLALDLKWKGLFFDPKQDYYKAMTKRPDMLNGELCLDASVVLLYLKAKDPKSEWFIRPSQDLKHFSGQVMKAGEIIAWLKSAMECESSGTYKIDENLLIVLAKPKVIQAEWRWFIVDGKVVDGSLYRAHGQMRQLWEGDKKVIREAQGFADGWLPAPCCVMDLALVDDEMKVIEFNCINSSGFYDHQVNVIFDKLWKYCEKM